MGFGAPIVRWFNKNSYFSKHFESIKKDFCSYTFFNKGNNYTNAVQKWVVQNYETTKKLKSEKL